MPDKHGSASGFQYSITNLKPAEPTENRRHLPDGAKREFAKGITGPDIAKGISRRWPSARWPWRSRT
jgi:threonyl-tRNA synthetase